MAIVLIGQKVRRLKAIYTADCILHFYLFSRYNSTTKSIKAYIIEIYEEHTHIIGLLQIFLFQNTDTLVKER